MKHRYDPSADSVGRRRLLRAGGAAIAAAAGAGVVAAATPAQATDGQPIIQGVPNNAGALNSTTAISNNGLNHGTLTLSNAATGTDVPTGLTVAGPTLVLQPNPTADFVDGPLGSLGMDQFGRIWAKTLPDPVTPEFVRTQFNTTEIVPIRPQRILDTQLNVSNVIANSGIISGGQLLAGKTLNLDLSDYVLFGTVVFANIAVVAPPIAGFITVWPHGLPRPGTSTINWSAGWTIANGLISGIGHPEGLTHQGLPVTDAISIFTSRNARFVVDITAFTVWDPQQINPAVLPPAVAAPSITKLSPEVRDAAAQRGFRLSNPR
jgi:hypothetical protein